jgi:hypothetical protein
VAFRTLQSMSSASCHLLWTVLKRPACVAMLTHLQLRIAVVTPARPHASWQSAAQLAFWLLTPPQNHLLHLNQNSNRLQHYWIEAYAQWHHRLAPKILHIHHPAHETLSRLSWHHNVTTANCSCVRKPAISDAKQRVRTTHHPGHQQNLQGYLPVSGSRAASLLASSD